MLKSFLFFILLFFSFYSWSAILINNITELQSIGNNPAYPINGEYELTQDIDASDTMNWNSGQGFLPIGTITNPFSGILDGKGYKVIGLYINRSSTDFVGLIANMSSTGIIRDLFLEDCSITGKNNVSFIVGRNSGTIARSNVIDGSLSASENVGSLTGYNLGNIRRSYATTMVVTGSTFVGGLVGRNEKTIEQCYSKGNVIGNNNVGGVVGASLGKKASIDRCYSFSSVLGYNSNVGGLLGSFTLGGKIRYCYSIGSVVGFTNTGGLIGYRSAGLICHFQSFY